MKGLYYVTIFDNYAALGKCLMLIKPAFIWLKIQKKTLILWNIITIFKECLCILIYFRILSFNSVMQSWIFSIITPVFRNHYNMLIYYQYWKQFSCADYIYLFIFLEPMILFWGSLINKKNVKEQHFIKYRCFLTIYTVCILYTYNILAPAFQLILLHKLYFK